MIALDAVDHSVVHRNLPDLTQADFELQGHGDADNPDVPNLAEVGPTRWPYSNGVEPSTHAPMFLSQPRDLSELVQLHDPFHGRNWVRIPTEAVLDVMTADVMSPDFDVLIAAPCALRVPPSMDRLATPWTAWTDATYSIQRKTLQTMNGRFALQDLNTSFVDFTEAKRSPGSIPN